jgi:hypothetical protein
MTQARFYSSTTKATTTTADPGASGATLTVADSTVFASLDGQFPYTLAINWGLADQELVNVTARPTGTTLTVVRGQDGTAGIAHPVGATVTHDVSARDFNEAGAHVGATSSVHGVTGQLVGTTDTQAMSNKTLTNSTLAVPMLGVFRSAAFSVTGTTLTVIPWDGEDYEDNVAANAMHNMSTNPSRLIAPIAGKYLLLATVEFKIYTAVAYYFQIKFRLNGATDIRWSTGPGTASQTNNTSISTVWKFAAGDYVEVLASSKEADHPVAVGASTTYATMSYLSA